MTKSWNKVKDEVRREHKDWPLKTVLKEASKRYHKKK